jgi:hypothetical protein
MFTYIMCLLGGGEVGRGWVVLMVLPAISIISEWILHDVHKKHNFLLWNLHEEAEKLNYYHYFILCNCRAKAYSLPTLHLIM